MTQSFYGKEDLSLGSKLAPELPGILRWAIEGWKRLTKRGFFVMPKSSVEAQRELEDLGSPIGAFLRDCCTVDQGLSVSSDELYYHWCAWCQDQGRDHPGTKQTFGRDLAAAVGGLRVTQPRDKNGKQTQRYYEGVGLSAEFVKRSDTRNRALYSNPTRSNPYITIRPIQTTTVKFLLYARAMVNHACQRVSE